MGIPFSIEQFLKVFKEYNLAVYPAQIILYILALVAIFFAIKRTKASNKIIASILSFFWLWMGIVYHIIFFTAINKAAYLFGILFILQGLLFFLLGVLKNQLSFNFHFTVGAITGAVLIAFALIIYPILSYYLGHVFPSSPTFGLPCPTTIFTLGIILWTQPQIKFSVFIIPLLWSFIGYAAAYALRIYEDTGLVVSGLITLIVVVTERIGLNKKQNVQTKIK